MDSELLLINMPFGPGVHEPSLGLSLLKAKVAPQGVRARVLYFTLDLAQRIGLDLYRTIASNEPTICGFAGEWIFEGALYGRAPEDDGGYVDEILRGRASDLGFVHTNFKPLPEELIGRIVAVRRQAAGFVEECLAAVLAARPRIVGFTSTFQQNVASLALARRIKEEAPGTFVVFGGANCEGVMGLEMLRQFAFVDAVVSGEGDLVFPELVRRVLAGEEPAGLPGVHLQAHGGEPSAAGLMAPKVQDMDALPYADFDDFFAQYAAADFGSEQAKVNPRVPFETSRGCWWGEKAHCTFCGLNGSNMKFRAKSAARALAELVHLHARFPGCGVSVTDNILDMSYFADFLPALAERKLDLQIFYEVKANLRKEQVRQLRDAGVTSIQPGIESFIDEVLSLMRKGVKALHNVQLLKWCKEYGVRPQWNMIWGFPGEPAGEYERLLNLVPLLTHLPPPGGGGVIRLDRFSPNFDHAAAFGFTGVAPYPAYRHIYPFDERAVFNLAYFFTFRYREPRDVAAYTRELRRALIAWRDEHETSDLFFVDKGERLMVWDLRRSAQEPLTILAGPLRTLYLACDSIAATGRLQKALEGETGALPAPQVVAELAAPLVERGLLVRQGDSYLALAIPLGEYSPGPRVVARFQELVRQLGQGSGKEAVILLPPSLGDPPVAARNVPHGGSR